MAITLVEKVCCRCKSAPRRPHGSYCRPCHNEMTRDERRRSPERAEKHRKAVFRNRYGLTDEDYDFLMAQACAICGGRERISVDHDHRTGEIRGALCRTCNSGLGFFKDNVELLNRALAYLGGDDLSQ